MSDLFIHGAQILAVAVSLYLALVTIKETHRG